MSRNKVFSPEPRSPLVRQVYNTLKDALLENKLKSGERLIEGVVAEELQVSRGVCREALRLLEQDGLVERTVNKGVRIASFNLKEAKELHQIRALLEILAYTETAKVIKTSEKKDTEKIIKAMKKFANEKNKKKVAELDYKLHDILVKISKLNRLYNMWSGLYIATRAWLSVVIKYDYDDLNNIVLSHQNLLNSIDSKDDVKIRQATCKHIFTVGNTWLNERTKWWQDMPFFCSDDITKYINKEGKSGHS